MNGLRLGRIFGIEVLIHWTFGLLVLFMGMQLRAEYGFFFGVALCLAAFACVLAHEFGHSLTARRFGIDTKRITLLPIGGVAQLDRMPRRPSHELWITVMGPAVNLVIALVLVPFVLLTSSSFLFYLMIINVVLLVFNLIPAFPMDGGRIFRALLAMRLPYAKATHIAARLGQILAVCYGVFSIVHLNVFGAILAMFVFGAATAERFAVVSRARFDAMRPSASPRQTPGGMPFTVVFTPPVGGAPEEPKWRNLTPDGPREGS